MQDEDVRQFDTTGKWLQFVYCLPSFLCVILFSLGQNPAKMKNISRPWPNLSSSKGSQDTSACQILGHNCHAFSIKYGNHIFEMFHWVKMPPKLVKSTDRDQNLTRWVDGTPTSEVTPVHGSYRNPRMKFNDFSMTLPWHFLWPFQVVTVE